MFLATISSSVRERLSAEPKRHDFIDRGPLQLGRQFELAIAPHGRAQDGLQFPGHDIVGEPGIDVFVCLLDRLDRGIGAGHRGNEYQHRP